MHGARDDEGRRLEVGFAGAEVVARAQGGCDAGDESARGREGEAARRSGRDEDVCAAEACAGGACLEDCCGDFGRQRRRCRRRVVVVRGKEEDG